MNWNPNQVPPQATAPAAVPGYGPPPGPGPQGFAPPAPQGFAPAAPQYNAPQGFGVPQAPQGYAPQPIAFQAQDPSLDDREEGVPVGSTSFECTGEVELGGQGRNLLVVKLRSLQSNNPGVAAGTAFAFKRSLVPHAKWGLKYASDEIGKFIVAIMGIDKSTPASQITPMITELVQRGTVGGQPITGRRGVVTGTQKQLPPKQGEMQGKVVTNGTWAKHP